MIFVGASSWGRSYSAGSGRAVWPASFFFTIIVLQENVAGAELIALVVACTVALSLILHGASASPLDRRKRGVSAPQTRRCRQMASIRNALCVRYGGPEFVTRGLSMEESGC